MMSEWKEYKLGEIAIINMGQSPKSEHYNNEGIGLPFLQGNRTFGRLFPSFDTFCSAPIKIANQNDILFSVRAPVGDINFAPTKLCIGRGLCSISSKFGNTNFLFYLLNYKRQEIINQESGTVFGSVNKQTLENLRVYIPKTLPTQTAIAEILSSLDDKIELNNAINKNLEDLAQALFKRWFVDFEFPNEEGLPYRSSGGEMVESELGMIPKGWRVGILNEIATLKKESVKPFSQPNGMFFHFSLPEFDNGKIPSKELGSNILSSKYRVFPFSVLISKLNPRIPRIWSVINCPQNSVCSTEFQVIKPREVSFFSFILCLASSLDFARSLQSKVTGTSSSHQRVNPKDIINHELVIPKPQSIQSFNEVTSPMFRLMEDNREGNKTLISLRDTLLPKLISGELEVNQALTKNEKAM